MRLTVAICTWNRAKLLNQTLEQMHQLRIPPGVEWELLVVNNNCTDDTDAVIARHADKLPARRLYEPKQGLSNARNAAVAAAQGDLLIWTDDDVLVEPNWIEEYVRAAKCWPDAAFFGGSISPWFEVQPPRWIVQNLKYFEGMLVIRDIGSEVRPFSATEYPFGANMAFRTEIQKRFLYDPFLGRRRDEAILGDENTVINPIRAAGGYGVWVPKSRVRHFIGANRMSAAYAWNYYHGGGRTFVRVMGQPSGVRLWGHPRWVIRRYWEKRFLSWLRFSLGQPSWVQAYTQAAHAAGMMSEIRASNRDPLAGKTSARPFPASPDANIL